MDHQPFLGLRTAIYTVRDLAKAKAWYSALFGTEPYFDEPFYVGFNIGGFELGLNPDVSKVKPGPGGVVAYWGVLDADARSTTIESNGFSVVNASENSKTFSTASEVRSAVGVLRT